MGVAASRAVTIASMASMEASMTPFSNGSWPVSRLMADGMKNTNVLSCVAPYTAAT